MNAYQSLMNNVRRAAGGGIWPHSSANHYFIFCVGQSLVKVNAFMSWAANNDIGVKPLFGKYKGQSERSFIANWDSYGDIKPWLKAEESILILGASNTKGQPIARLHYLSTGEEVPMGRMVQVTRDEAMAQDSWTICPLTKCYYICR